MMPTPTPFRRTLVCAVAAATALVALHATAADADAAYPTRPIKLIVAFAPVNLAEPKFASVRTLPVVPDEGASTTHSAVEVSK